MLEVLNLQDKWRENRKKIFWLGFPQLNYLNRLVWRIFEQLLPFPLCFFCFCSLSLSNGKSLRSKLYKFLANTLVSVSMVRDHSVANSSQKVNDDSTDSKSSQSSREMYTFRFALIQATMRVYKDKYSKITMRFVWSVTSKSTIQFFLSKNQKKFITEYVVQATNAITNTW